MSKATRPRVNGTDGTLASAALIATKVLGYLLNGHFPRNVLAVTVGLVAARVAEEASGEVVGGEVGEVLASLANGIITECFGF